ncbi:odorant receptor 82a-like [Odontomachus brunneus]|uniref:odorant receptor 82a-like n=1 Tax=Odontomachus brunneus TaxID=486640 RepID=UPI0013F1B594|nr:odorant receptor 82a-like [Odontomachus brunneus]
MYNNKNYERDINYTYELNRFVLRLLGIWPYTNTNFWILQKTKETVLIFGFFVLLSFELTSMLLYIFMVLKGTRARIKVMATLLFTIVSILKYSNLLYIKNQMRSCMARVEKDFQSVTSPTARNTMLFHVRTGRRLFILCSIFMYGAGMTYRTLIPLSRGKIVTAQNITIRPLPSPAYYVVFDPQISPTYEIVFFVQCFTGLFKYTITVAACGVAALFTMHIVAQLDILMALMNNLTNEHEDEDVNRKLSVIVEHQIKTRNLLHMVQGVIQYSSLIEVTTCTSMLCLIIYYVIMEWEASNTVAMCTYFIIVISLTFNIFVYCFIGEQLSEKEEQVALTACTLDWHLLPNANARALILIMLISNKPMKLKAGNFVELSFRTFGSVVKTALGYLNLLRSVVD